LVGFSLIFLTNGFQDRANAEIVSFIPPAFLIGRVTNRSEMEWINNLAATSQENRHDFNLDLQTDNEPIDNSTYSISRTSVEYFGTASSPPSVVLVSHQPLMPRAILSSSSRFILDISALTQDLKWQFCIQPEEMSYNSEFISILAEWCRTSGVGSQSTVSKVCIFEVVNGVFTLYTFKN
jgi:hypothetical protein